MKLIFNTNTTGNYPIKDEILQFSAIDEKGNVLMNVYFKPEHTSSWSERVSSDMVKNQPYFKVYKDRIQSLFDQADELITYDGLFDMVMLESQGIVINKKVQHYDVKKMYDSDLILSKDSLLKAQTTLYYYKKILGRVDDK